MNPIIESCTLKTRGNEIQITRYKFKIIDCAKWGGGEDEISNDRTPTLTSSIHENI
jgi:hypothetical protein